MGDSFPVELHHEVRSLTAYRRIIVLDVLAILISVPLACRKEPAPAPHPSLRASSVSSVGQKSSEGQEFLRRAGRSYYNLIAQGVIGLQFKAEPDWDSASKLWRRDARDKILPILKRTHFQIVIGPGVARISHQIGVRPPNEGIARMVHEQISNVDGTVEGLLKMWSLFAIQSPFSVACPDYQLEDVGEMYHLRCNGLFVSMDHDFAIEEMRITSPSSGASASVRPKLVASGKGFLVSALDVAYKYPSGDSKELSATITYKNVDGVEVPGEVSATMTVPTGSVTIPIAFTDFQVKKQ